MTTTTTVSIKCYPDHLGTPRAITTSDASNTKVWEWKNDDPFGNSAADENPSGLGTFEYNLRFPGMYRDVETATFYNYFRTYNAATGRYEQSDPIGLIGGTNTYAYVGGSPLLFTDPLGLVKIPGIPNAEGETSIHANPGPNATDFRPEHGPNHVHLGGNDGPRVRTSDFEPFSKDDAKKLSRKQKKFCEALSEESKDLIRKRQSQIFKSGKILLQIQGGGLLSIAAACRADPGWCLDQIDNGVLP